MKHKSNLESIKKAIDILGDLTKFSIALSISYQTGMAWKHGRRTPSPIHCIKIQQLTNGEVKAIDILPEYPWKDFSQI